MTQVKAEGRVFQEEKIGSKGTEVPWEILKAYNEEDGAALIEDLASDPSRLWEKGGGLKRAPESNLGKPCW